MMIYSLTNVYRCTYAVHESYYYIVTKGPKREFHAHEVVYISASLVLVVDLFWRHCNYLGLLQNVYLPFFFEILSLMIV
jgi:hypothetical protein